MNKKADPLDNEAEMSIRGIRYSFMESGWVELFVEDVSLRSCKIG